MKRFPLTLLMAAAQFAGVLVFLALCAVWFVRTRQMRAQEAESNARMTDLAQNRQAIGALVQDAALYSERSPAMKTLLGQIGVKVNPPDTKTPSANPARR